jgi:hypothetical protein
MRNQNRRAQKTDPVVEQSQEEQWRRADEEARKGLPPGVKLVRTLDSRAEATARGRMLYLSPAALGSDWVTLERSTGLFRSLSNAGGRFIPLLWDSAGIACHHESAL